MLATPTRRPGTLPVDGATWAYEVKWDGMRLLVDVSHRGVHLASRTERDVTTAFPDLAGLPDALPGLPAHGGDVLLDGEVVALDPQGRPSFGVLAPRLHVTGRRAAAAAAAAVPVAFVAFDVLRVGGRDVTGRPLRERREVLEELAAGAAAPGGPAVQVSPVFPHGADVLQATLAQGLEGAVAKRWTSPYRPGERSPDWVKAAHRLSRTVVVGGWRPQEGTRDRIGSLLVGAPDADGRLVFLGRVGSGVGPRAAADLDRRLRPLRATASPFATPVPAVDARGTTWCLPELAVEVRSLGATVGGRLRQPAYVGIRDDAVPDVEPDLSGDPTDAQTDVQTDAEADAREGAP